MYNFNKLLLAVTISLPSFLKAGLITAVPGPDDQGGMIMPMVSIDATEGTGSEPTAGSVVISFDPSSIPELRPLTHWSPGDWFAETAAWRADLSPADGAVSGMPAANAGNGDLFNNQYGFMFMSMGTMMSANIPSGNSLAIRLDHLTNSDLKAYNYVNNQNLWDQVFDDIDSQVLWNGTMWHNYFTMPADTEPGTYSARFEIFIASTPFTGTTGFAQYDAAALSATANPNFTSAFIEYEFTVIPEPAHFVLLFSFVIALFALRRRSAQASA